MTKEKSLQKLTDIKKIDSVEDVQEYLKNHPDQHREVENYLRARLNENYLNKDGMDQKITDMIVECARLNGKESDLRNVTYEYNHVLITDAIHNHVLKHRIFPTTLIISTKTGLSRQTIYNHLKEGAFSKHRESIDGKNEFMANNALNQLYLIGIENRSVSALKAFIELSGATSKHPPAVTNYIQINNLKLSKEDFYQLPESTLSKIEKIISKDLDKLQLREPIEVRAFD